MQEKSGGVDSSIPRLHRMMMFKRSNTGTELMPRSSSCYVDGVLHRTRQIWASCDREMLRTALFLSMEMGREANLLMKPLQVLNKRQSCAGGGNKSGRCSECSGAVVRLTRSVTSPATGMGPSHSQTWQPCLAMLCNVLIYSL